MGLAVERERPGRWAAIEALGRLGHAEDELPVLAHLADEPRATRRALAQLGGAATVARLREALALGAAAALSGTARTRRCPSGMRSWGLPLLAVGWACGPAGSAPPAAPAPAPPRLATPGHLFLISTEDGSARCKRWDVVPTDAGDGQLIRARPFGGQPGVDTIDYAVRGATLTLTGRTRRQGAQVTTTGCEVRLPYADLADAVAVGDSRWFAHAAGCTLALARRARVATDLTGCQLERDLPEAARLATRRRFDALLREGGAAYVVMAHGDEAARCESFNVTPSQHPRGQLVTGSMWHEIVSRGVHGTEGTSYAFLPGGSRAGGRGPDELSLLGSGRTDDDGSGSGIGCGRTAWVSYGRDVVQAHGTLYLSQAACQDDLAAQRLHDAWVPEVVEVDDLDDDATDDELPEDDEAAGELTSTSFGLGC